MPLPYMHATTGFSCSGTVVYRTFVQEINNNIELRTAVSLSAIKQRQFVPVGMNLCLQHPADERQG